MTVTRGGILAAVFVTVVAGVCVRLGFWQLDRLEQRRAANAVLAEAVARPPLLLPGDSLAAIAAEPGRFLARPVRARGAYLPGSDVVLRGRAHAGQPGVHLVTAFRLEGSDTALLVNRGWAPSPDAATVDPGPLAEPGVHQVAGILQLVPLAGEDALPADIDVGGRPVRTYRRLDLATLQEALGVPLLPVYLQQLPGDAPRSEPPLRVPLPEMDEGSHLGYAVQWFSFAAIAVGGFLLLAYRRTRPGAS